jgi:hypothetical protein
MEKGITSGARTYSGQTVNGTSRKHRWQDSTIERKGQARGEAMKTFCYYADAGSARIRFRDGSAFLNNGVGDGSFDIHILEDDEHSPVKKFAGYFTVKTMASLMEYDCEEDDGWDEVLYEFSPGRYYASHDDDGNIYITKFKD